MLNLLLLIILLWSSSYQYYLEQFIFHGDNL